MCYLLGCFYVNIRKSESVVVSRLTTHNYMIANAKLAACETAKIYVLICYLQTNRMAFDEISIDPRFHRHIVGRNGANS